MVYEIPQQLEYKEKIMFGLTFRQLAYALGFGLVALIIIKSGMNVYVKGVLACFPVVLGCLFMFFGFDVVLKDWFRFMRFRKAYSDKALNDFVGVKSINDGVIHADKRIAVFKVTPINFAIKPDAEKDSITEVFQKFLNSIDFPVQILMNTDTLDLKDYFKSLQARIDKKYSKLFDSFRKHMDSTISSNSVMNRNFYLVIPEHSNLDIQLKICEEKLINLNLQYSRLNTAELKKLVGKSFGSLKSTIPAWILNKKDHIQTGNINNRIIFASGYPRVVESGFLDKIVSSVGDFDLSIHINPFPIDTMMIGLNKELQKQRADLYAAELKGMVNPSLEIKYKDTRKILEELQKGKDKLFNVSMYVNCKAKSLEELELISRKIQSELNSLMIIPKVSDYRMAKGLKSVSPLGIDELKEQRNITTTALSAFFPFTSPFLQVDESGVWLGMNRNNIPIIRDIFKLSNSNGIILAQSGGGKSYFSKLLIARYLLNNTKVMVVDPQGEYRSLVKQFNGQRVDLSRTSKTMINPLDLMGHDYAEKRLSLMDLMQVILGELTEPQKSFIDRALTEAYEKKGIGHDPDTWNYEPPILGDVLNVLQNMEKGSIQLEKSTIRSLFNRLSMYVDGVFSFLNQQTNINFNNRFVCFDIGNMPKQVKPVIMFLVLDYVYMKMKNDIERKILLIDEAWSLLSRTEDASYIFEIVKTCRKFNLGLLLINQEVEGLLNSEAGKSVLANSAYTLLMRQKPAVIDDVCKTFHLSKHERTHLLTSNVGEGILIMEDDHTEIKVVASKEEHRIITTNADELLKDKIPKKQGNKKSKHGDSEKRKHPKKVPSAIPRVRQAKRKQPVAKVTVDQFKGCYKHKELGVHDIKYLLSKGYKEVMLRGISEKKSQRYLIKPRFNESIIHMFLVYDIAEFLEKKGIKTQKFITKKPDITFNLGKKKVGIEVETGATNKKSKKQILEKVKLLNKYYDDWFFVVTNRNYVTKYKQLGKTFEKRNLVKKLNQMTNKR